MGHAAMIGEAVPAPGGPNDLDALRYPPPALPHQPGRVREYTLVAQDTEIEVAKGVFYPAWTYNGTVPGPGHPRDRGRHPPRRASERRRAPAHDPLPRDPPGEHGRRLRDRRSRAARFTYEFPARPYGMHLYHCHATPLKKHIHKGLYGAFIIDPPEPRPPAQELVMVMNGFDTDGDGENNFYTVNGLAFYYAKYPIRVQRSQTVRIYLANLTEFDLINSFHLHGDFFRYYPTGHERHVRVHGHGHALPGPARDHRDRLREHGQLHVPRAPVRVRRARLDGLLRGRRTMSAKLGAAEPAARGARWRLWALVPIVLLVAVVSLFAARGGSLLDLVGENPPPPDEFDVRRVEFSPGEIRIRVTNPQREDLTIATVTVDDAIVPFTRRRPSHARAAALGDDRRPVRLGRGRADRRRRDELDRHPDDARDRGRGRDARAEPGGLPRLRADRRPRRHRPGRARPALAAVAPARAARVAGGVHGADRRAADLPRARGAHRGARAAGGAARRPGRHRARRCSASPRATSP